MGKNQPFEKRFFAASNSSHGFHNDYPRCFGEESGVDRLYAIKGGPGTGKSYLMRSIARRAEAKGYDVTYYYCSSDPSSLDGIRMTKSGAPCLAVIDGTPPHTWEPMLAGAREELIDLGAFWQSERLQRELSLIRSLSTEKAACYRRAYQYLAGCGKINAVAEDLTATFADRPKLERCAHRILRDLPGAPVFAEIPARLRAISMKGTVTFDTLRRMAESHINGQVIWIEDHYGLAYELTAILLEHSREKGGEVWVSGDPVHTHKVDGLYYPATGLCILVASQTDLLPSGGGNGFERVLSLRRYADPTALSLARKDLRETMHAEASLKRGAADWLMKAAKYHFDLEKIYAAAMDFKTKEAHDLELINKLFGS